MRVRALDFQLGALYAALDEKRGARGLTWAGVMREINVVFEHNSSRPISQSTVTSLRHKAVAEGDGVLQMLRWLDRTPESFVPGLDEDAGAPLPRAAADRVIRFDTRKLHSALDAARLARGMTWRDVAAQIPGFTAGSLAYLAKGGRTGFPHVVRLTRWLGRPVAEFTRITTR